jgi:hypothetical protein
MAIVAPGKPMNVSIFPPFEALVDQSLVRIGIANESLNLARSACSRAAAQEAIVVRASAPIAGVAGAMQPSESSRLRRRLDFPGNGKPEGRWDDDPILPCQDCF